MAKRKTKSTRATSARKAAAPKRRKPTKRQRTPSAASAGQKSGRTGKPRTAKKTTTKSHARRAKSVAPKGPVAPVSGASLDKLIKRLRDELTRDQRAAWLVDVSAALLIPLNQSGAELFDRNETQPDNIELETAMPALATLRKRDAEHAQTGTRAQRQFDETLEFWTNTGARTLACHVTRHRVRGRTLFLIQSQTEPARLKDASANPTSEGANDEQPRDDAAILREIARRIRAGTAGDVELSDEPGELPMPNPTLTPNNDQDQTTDSPDGVDTSQEQRAKLAHELRTPLSAIVAAAEVLKDERLGVLDNFHYRGYARDIYQSARHALELIERGLNLDVAHEHRAATAPPPLPTDRADLNHLVRSALAAVKHQAKTAEIDIKFEPAERDTWIQLDATAITQVVLNLLTNAIKFTPKGGHVVVEVCANIGEDVYVEVRDTGPGMSKAEIDQHLRGQSDQPLQQRPGGGLGIGLPLSRQLAEDNGATLHIDSVPGRGTTARLAFPLRQLMAV